MKSTGKKPPNKLVFCSRCKKAFEMLLSEYKYMIEHKGTEIVCCDCYWKHEEYYIQKGKRLRRMND